MSGCRQRFFEPLYAVTQQNKVCALKRDELEIASNDLFGPSHRERSVVFATED